MYIYILNTAKEIVSQESTRQIMAPVAIIGALSIGTRVTAGILAQSIKGARLVADYADKNDLSQSLAQVESRCGFFATRGIKTELKAAAVLTATVAFCLGLEALAQQPKVILNESVTDVISTVFHNIKEDMLAHPIKSYFEISFATIILSVSYSWAEVAGRSLKSFCK